MEAKQKSSKERKSRLNDFLPLIFGTSKYTLMIPRFVAQSYPFINLILTNEPNLQEIHFMKSKELAEEDKQGLDLLFSLEHSHPERSESSYPELADFGVVTSALRWSSYFGLNEDADKEVRVLFSYLGYIYKDQRRKLGTDLSRDVASDFEDWEEEFSIEPLRVKAEQARAARLRSRSRSPSGPRSRSR